MNLGVGTNRQNKAARTFFITLYFAIFTLIVVNSRTVGEGVFGAFVFSFKSVLPSLFPFFILSDMFLSMGLDFGTPLFERVFKINKKGANAFVIGLLCGFPIGAKVALDLYRCTQITKDECQRLIGFTNNTGPAFAVCVLGIGMRGSIIDGIIIYIIEIASAVAVGAIFGIGKNASKIAEMDIAPPKFSLIDSTKDAVSKSLNIAGFIALFAAVISLVRLIPYEPIRYIAICVGEVFSALQYLSSSPLAYSASLALSAFALCFSSISVHLQTASLIKENEISFKGYLYMKLLQGLIAALIALIVGMAVSGPLSLS